jgi:arginase
VAKIQSTGVHTFTMREIDERGLRAVMSEAFEVASAGTSGFHVSFDMDSVDPREAPGVGTPVRGGLTYREAHLGMEIINDSGRMLGMEVVEVNPVLDIANQTAILGVELVLSALGKRIL